MLTVAAAEEEEEFVSEELRQDLLLADIQYAKSNADYPTQPPCDESGDPKGVCRDYNPTFPNDKSAVLNDGGQPPDYSELIDSTNSPFSKGKILEDGRCCDRSMIEELKRVKPNASIGGRLIPDIDFRTDTSQEALDFMYHCRTTSAQAWTDHALVQDINEGQIADISGDKLIEWQDVMTDEAFKSPGPISEEFWGDEKLIRGFAIENKVNVYIYKTGKNVNVYMPLFTDETFTESILLTNHVDKYDNGLHFDLTWHYSPKYTDYDKLLWPKETCITSVSSNTIASLRDIVDMPVHSKTGDMITGAHFALPPHLMRTDESLERLAGQMIEAWSIDVVKDGFNVNRIPRSMLDRWNQQSLAHPKMDRNGNGALYLRACSDTWENHSSQIDNFLDSDIDEERYLRLPEFLQQYQINQNAFGIRPSDASSIVYGGETSSGLFSVRQAQEDDALVPDNARLNWECGQQLEVTHRILLGNNGGDKRNAWIMESFKLGTMELATRRTLNDNDETYCMLGNCLNQIRGGLPYFLEIRGGGGGIELIVNWFTGFPLDQKDKLIFSAEVNAPHYILSWLNFHSAAFVKFLGGIALGLATVNQAHKFMSTRGYDKRIENVKNKNKCSTAAAKAIVADRCGASRNPLLKNRNRYSIDRDSLDLLNSDTLEQKRLAWNRAIFVQKHPNVNPDNISTEELKEFTDLVNFAILSISLEEVNLKCKRCNNTFNIDTNDAEKLSKLNRHFNRQSCTIIGDQFAAQRENDDDEASSESDVELRCANCNATAEELNIQANAKESQNTLLTKHQSSCPTQQQWGTWMKQVLSKGRPTQFGTLPFTRSSDRTLHDAIRFKTGTKKMNNKLRPVVGERRADLESAGYTQEMGFFP